MVLAAKTKRGRLRVSSVSSVSEVSCAVRLYAFRLSGAGGKKRNEVLSRFVFRWLMSSA